MSKESTTEPRFNPTDFFGVVQLKAFSLFPNGKQYNGIAGKVSILADKDVVGFEVKGSETANWIARIDGINGSVNVLGCQIRMVHQYDAGLPDAIDNNYYLVP